MFVILFSVFSTFFEVFNKEGKRKYIGKNILRTDTKYFNGDYL